MVKHFGGAMCLHTAEQFNTKENIVEDIIYILTSIFIKRDL